MFMSGMFLNRLQLLQTARAQGTIRSWEWISWRKLLRHDTTPRMREKKQSCKFQDLWELLEAEEVEENGAPCFVLKAAAGEEQALMFVGCEHSYWPQ